MLSLQQRFAARKLDLRRWAYALTGALLLPGAASAIPTQTIDFEGFAHGEIIDTDYAAQGITSFTITNLGGGPDLGVVGDTSMPFAMDPDLEGPPASMWDVGNLAPDTVLGNILFIQENSIGCQAGEAPGTALDICDNPDDEGSRPAGSIDILFSEAINTFGWDIIDVDSVIDELGTIVFHDGATTASLDWIDLQMRDNTIVYGNNSANRIIAFTPAEVTALTGTTITQFDRIVINMGGSGAIDNLVIPEPGTAVLLISGMLGMAWFRRRRS